MEQHLMENSLTNSDGIATQQSTKGKHIKVVLADDEPKVRRNLRSLLESEPDFEVIGEVNNGFDALDQVGNLSPDILVCGLNASNIIEIVRLVNQRYPNTAIVIPHRNDNESYVNELMRAGLKVSILKRSSESKFINIIRELHLNKTHSSSTFSKPTSGNITWHGEKVTVDPYEILTTREREVLDLVVTGLTNVMIAARLNISPRTVEIHRANMLRKLGLLNQHQQLTKYAIERQILSNTNQEK
jgi:two-component system response regulator NreC